jgi:hypothetical protein
VILRHTPTGSGTPVAKVQTLTQARETAAAGADIIIA